MWYIIKSKKNSVQTLKKNLQEKLGLSTKFYEPIMKLTFKKKNKLFQKKVSLLNNYILCFHENFCHINIINTIKNTEGLNLILEGSKNNQRDINNFISACKKHEDEEGFIQSSYFNYREGKEYRFLNGPLTNFLIKLTDVSKNSLEAFVGSMKVTVCKRKNFLETV